jgi:hypothetical protein
LPRITISYRRDDSGVITGRIFDRLAAHYGRESVFRDIDNIPPGADFRKHIDQVLDDSDIVLAIVGPKWVGPRANQSRLANAADPVRVEIETVLRKDKPLIPVLVQRASMPRVEQLPETMHDFAFRNAVDIDAGRDFDHHMTGLIRAMDRILEVGAEHVASAGVTRIGAVIEAAPQFGDDMRDQNVEREPDAQPTTEVQVLRETNAALETELSIMAERQKALEQEIAILRDRILSGEKHRGHEIGLLKSGIEPVSIEAASESEDNTDEYRAQSTEEAQTSEVEAAISYILDQPLTSETRIAVQELKSQLEVDGLDQHDVGYLLGLRKLLARSARWG